MNCMRKLVLMGAVGLALCFGRSALADSVTFSTTGSFAGTDSVGGAALVVNTTTLTFAGASATSAQSSPFAVVNLGTFTLSSLATPPGDTFAPNDTFTVSIDQLLPPGTGTSTASVIGTVTTNSGGALLINFAPDPVAINGESYLVEPTEVPFPGSNVGKATLQAILSGPVGATTSTPLPAPLFASAGLMGMVGTVKARRRFFST
jgi:hypothetical protein